MMQEGKERRKFKRANFPCKIHILSVPSYTIECRTENIGAGGVRVVITEKLLVSSIVGLELYLSENPIQCEGKVVWLVEKGKDEKEDEFDIGIEFRRITNKDREIITLFVESLV